MSKSVVQWILTPKSAIFITDDGLPITILSTDGRYNSAVDMIRSGKLNDALTLADKAKAIDLRSDGKFTVLDGVIHIDGEDLPKSLSDKLLSLVEAGESTDYLEKFWDNLRLNPTKESREDLFSFLQANNVPITKDGCFITYKKVRDDYWDSHTGNTFLNKPGKTIAVERSSVDPNRHNTCSTGLHVAAYEYASNFSGQRLLECKVNPRDVVAVPPDYSNQKMRVCRYQILRETDRKFEENLYNNDAETQVESPLVEENSEIFVVSRDSERRIRIPGHMVRKLKVGVGRRVAVFAEGGELRLLRGSRGDQAEFNYNAHTDNSIRVSNKVLESAGLNGDSFSVELDTDGALVVRPVV